MVRADRCTVHAPLQRQARDMRRTAIGLIATLLIAGCASSSGSGSPAPRPGAGPLCGFRDAPPPTYRHVVWLLQENESEREVIGSGARPYINRTLLRRCGLATNFHNVSHPSLPNYLSLVSGMASGAARSSNCSPSSCPQRQESLFEQVQAAGGQWRQYAQAQPGNCSPVKTDKYEPHHAVPVFFPALAAQCRQWDVPAGAPSSGQLRRDLSAGILPTFAFITPDGDHEKGTAGDQWLDDWISLLTATQEYRSGHTAIFVTWDEGGGSDKTHGEPCAEASHAATSRYPSCWVTTLVISPSTRPGSTSARYFTHYSLLRTTEELLGLKTDLGLAAEATGMRNDFNV